MNKDEKNKVTEAILKQKVANNSKAEKTYAEYRDRKNIGGEATRETILLKVARVASGASVRWKRNFQKEDERKHERHQADARDEETPAMKAGSSHARGAGRNKRPRRCN